MRKLGTIGIVLIGVLICVQALKFASDSVFIVLTSARPLGGRTLVRSGASLVFAATLLAAGSLVVWKRNRLLGDLLEGSESDADVDTVPFLEAGLILIGVWLAATAFPNLTYSVYLAIWQSRAMVPAADARTVVVEMIMTGVARHLAEIGVGAGLIVCSGRLARRLLAQLEDAT